MGRLLAEIMKDEIEMMVQDEVSVAVERIADQPMKGSVRLLCAKCGKSRWVSHYAALVLRRVACYRCDPHNELAKSDTATIKAEDGAA